MFSRRDFIKLIGAFGLVLTPLNKLIRKTSFGTYEGQPSDGELYEGFVLLDVDTPIPLFVEGAPCPILCQVEESETSNLDVAAFRGEVVSYDSIESLSENLNFRIFIPDSLPHKMVFLQGQIIKFAGSGEVWEARLDFGFEDTREPFISLAARPIFARPYPVWPVTVYPKKEVNEVILDTEYVVEKPKKVTFTPHMGIMLPTDEGYTLQWITKDVLYTMFMEYSGWRNKPEEVGKSLIEQ